MNFSFNTWPSLCICGLQVLSSDVNLQTEQQMQDVMKRMSKQYIGHGYQSRFSTKNFRVTYDCCNRCSGPLYVV